MTERNALAELAERMRNQYDNQTSWWQDDKEGKDFDKAQRIVAELAKVESLRLKMNDLADKGEVVEAETLAHELKFTRKLLLKNCRAIAEEGAK